MKILFPIDDKSTLAEVVEYTRAQHWPSDTEIRLLCVIQPIEMMVPWSVTPIYPAELYNEMNDSATRVLKEAKTELAALGFTKLSSEVCFGPPTFSIVDELKQYNPDLVVMGSHKRSGLEKLLVGSVAQSVAEQAPCSVLVLKPPAVQAGK